MSDERVVLYQVIQPVNPDDDRTEYVVQYWGKPEFTFLLDSSPRWISDSASYRDLSDARDRKRAMLEFKAKVRIVERTVKTEVVE